MNHTFFTAIIVLALVGCGTERRPEAKAEQDSATIESATKESVAGDDSPTLTGETAIKLHRDGFPTGNDTPESAATDFVRAFIGRDAQLFHKRRWVVMCEGYNDPRIRYEHFLTHKPTKIARSSIPKPIESASSMPQRISKVYASRQSSRFTKDLVTSSKLLGEMGHEAFVDVISVDESGTQYLSRVSVSQRKDKVWYAAMNNLHEGESKSTKDFSEVYKLSETSITNR